MLEKYKVFTGLFFGALWVLLTYGFISEELIPPLLPLKSFVFLLCDIVFLGLGVCMLRSRRDIIVALSFLIIGVISSKLNNVGMIVGINGARDFFGLIFAVPICRYLLASKNRERFIATFDRQLWIFLFVQAFCVTWQFVRYGANDHGGGSMGYGFSGIVSTLIYIISFYLLSKRWKFGNYWRNLRNNFYYILLLFPSFLNETKISFIFLLSYFLLLLPFEWKTVVKIFVSIPLILTGIIGAGMLYLSVTGQDLEAVFSQEAMDDYFIGEDPEELMDLALALQDEIYDEEDIGQVDIPRFTKLLLVPEALDDSAGEELLGAGLGQFKGGNVIALSSYADRWQWLLSGSIPFLFSVLIQLGFCGVVWLFYNLITLMWPSDPRLMGKNIKFFVWIILALLMLYNDSLRFFPLCVILFYIVIVGYAGIPVLPKSESEYKNK